MKLNFLGLSVFIVLLFVPGCATERGDGFKPRTSRMESFTLATRGEPGQHFVAKLNIDGREREITGVSPAEYPLEANVVAGTIQKTSGTGTLQFTCVSGQSTVGFGTLTAPNSSFRFRYHARGVEVWN